jgi:fatty acid desaturase
MTTATHRNIARHRFRPELLRCVQTYYALDNWHGPLEILEHWTVIILATAGSVVAWEQWPVFVAAPIFVLAVWVIGGRQRALAGVLHQACHGTLMANRHLGQILGAVFGGYPVFQSFSGYTASHVRDHHGHFGDRDRDPDYLFYEHAGLYCDGDRRAAFRRHVAGILSPLSTIRYIAFMLRYRIFAAQEHRLETIARLFLYAIVIVASIWLGGAWMLLVYWLLPLATAQVWIGSFAELLEHFPLMDRGPAIDIYMSHNRDFGPLWYALLGEKRGEGYHLVHHLFPRVPIWHLHRVHQLLLADPDYARNAMPHDPQDAFRAIEEKLLSAG